MDWFKTLSPILQALLATLFTWGMTALGASLVFLLRSFNQKLLDGMMGFAGGVMIAASFFSLLLPAMDLAGEAKGVPTWFPIVSGFLLGGVFIGAIDKLLPHLHVGFPRQDAEGLPTSMHRSVLLVLAITLHNIPEGLAVGVAFGSLVHELPGATLGGAVALALGIGIQNFPEGTSVSMPLRREGFTRRKSFAYGQASGVVEPIAGVIGASAVLLIEPMLPYALSFAAGAMIYVVVEELIPESQLKGNTDIATIGVMGGFAIMMALDVALGG
jgi:ZIP family zinc transporter